MDLFSFSNPKDKNNNNKLYTTGMHLQSLHAIGTAYVCFQLILPLKSCQCCQVTLFSYHIFHMGFAFGRETTMSHRRMAALNISWTVRNLLDCHHTHLLVIELHFEGWLSSILKLPCLKWYLDHFLISSDFLMSSKLNDRKFTRKN